MALDPRIILGIRPLETPAEMDSRRIAQQIAQQEVELRRQEIDQRGQALRDAAMRKNQPAQWDPKKATEDAQYQLLVGNTIADKFRAAQADPSAWPATRRFIGQFAGPQAMQSLPENWDEAAPIVAQHVAAWPEHEADVKKNLQQVTHYDPDSGTNVVEFVTPTPGLKLQQAEPKPATEKTPAIGSFEDYMLQTYGPRPTSAQITEGRKVYNQADDKAQNFAASDVTKLTPAGIDLAAVNLRKRGVMIPLGMGDKSNRQAIINRAATLTDADIARIEATGGDIAANAAGYGADAGSLKKLQSQRDAIGAFENTAKKNIDIFLDTAGKVVDTGSPLANSVARTLSGKVLGSPDQAAYETARRIAINEVAKITNNPTLAGQLSDQGRKEVESFNPENATLAQSVRVMRILKRDMQNRTDSLDEALAGVRTRIGGSSNQKTDTTATTQSNPAGLSYADYLKSKGKK